MINNFLVDKNSFIFESVEKGKIKGRYTIFGKGPDKIWEFNQKRVSSIISGKKKIIKGDPKIILSKIIDDFRFKIPSSLPPMCSMIAGYFSYDAIRYIEKIKDSCKNDLMLPDIRLIRPTTLIIHDNVKKEIFFVKNIFSDIKINNLEKKYFEIQDEINSLLISSRVPKFQKDTSGKMFNIKSNISIKALIKGKFSLTGLDISTKSIDIKNLITFVSLFRNDIKVFLAQRFVKKGFVVSDIKIEFDDFGNVKNNYKINGLVQDVKINVLDKYELKKLDFIFEISNDSFTFNDIQLLINNKKIFVPQILALKKNEEFLVSGKINNKKTTFNAE